MIWWFMRKRCLQTQHTERPVTGRGRTGRAAPLRHLLLLGSAISFLGVGFWQSHAKADTEISTDTTTALTTSSSGNITIDQSSSVEIQTASTSAVILNSNNYVINNGTVANTGVDSAIGIQIDTSAGNIVPGASGLASTGSIDVGGNGTGKYGIQITGGHTFYGPVSLSSLTEISTTGSTSTAQTSSIIVQGDSSSAFYLVQGTTITSNVLFGGSGIVQDASTKSSQTSAIMVDLDGTVNGNVYLSSALSGVGPGMAGLAELGGIHSCASDLSAPSGFSCAASSGGTLAIFGNIALAGTSTVSSKGSNPEAGSALIVGGSIDGGIVIAGPATGTNTTAVTLTSSGLITSSSSVPVIHIDPSNSTSSSGTLRGPIVIGPLTADMDSIDPGYSIVNRGSIGAKPTDSDLSTAAVVIQGQSSTYYTCLSTTASSCNTTATSVTEAVTDSSGNISNVTYLRGGGLLNTGTIAAQATTTTETRPSSGIVSATTLYIGSYTTVPRIDIKSEAVSNSSRTAGTISALVSGIGQGNAYAILIGSGATVPTLTVGQNASVSASVTTTTTSPTESVASSSSPFTLYSTAILDESNSLSTINNAGTIQATNTTLTPGPGASVVNVTRAIDLSASTISAIQINNSGQILGDILFGSSGNGATLNVGNLTANGNPSTGIVNTASNYAVVAGSIISQNSGAAPSTNAGTIDFGAGSNQSLHVGSFGYVDAVIQTSSAGEVAIQVDSNGQLYVANTSSSVQASTLTVLPNGTLGLAISQQNLNSTTPVVLASSNAVLSGANIGFQFGTYIAASDPSAPTAQTITLVRAPVIVDTTLADQNAQLAQNTPFLFESPASANVVSGDKGPTPLTIQSSTQGFQTLLLHLQPRSVNATNPDGSPGLNLSGSAKMEYPFISAALATDTELGAAIATSLTVYKTPGVPSSGINVGASQQQAQRVFSEFAPDVSGGTREIAIMLTDSASGPVASRQRLLRSFGDIAGNTTLWGEEFTGQISNKGQTASDGTLTTYKDHGFGFTLGVDGGGPRTGWYGGAFTFYSGDVTQDLPRATRTNTDWYMLTGYTDWKGKHLFLDTQASLAYGDFEESRSIDVGNVSRTATSRRPGALAAAGATTGVLLNYAGIEVDPHVSLDGMILREEGYDEANGGSGLNLDVAPYFANSLRGAVGADIKGKLHIWGLDFDPEARVGYRYDLLQESIKIKAAFEATGGRSTDGNTMTFIGPDPDRGNTILGAGLGASTDTWQIGVNYDWIRGNNGSTTQLGILTVLGRI